MSAKQGQFWRSMPGMITAVAGLLAAVAGLITALSGTGLFSPAASPTDVSGARAAAVTAPPRRVTPLCASCRAKEARYWFRDEELLEAPRTLCFECFRLEIVRRQERAEELARARNATQLELSVSERLNQIDQRRRRAQIAARRALGL